MGVTWRASPTAQNPERRQSVGPSAGHRRIACSVGGRWGRGRGQCSWRRCVVDYGGPQKGAGECQATRGFPGARRPYLIIFSCGPVAPYAMESIGPAADDQCRATLLDFVLVCLANRHEAGGCIQSSPLGLVGCGAGRRQGRPQRLHRSPVALGELSEQSAPGERAHV